MNLRITLLSCALISVVNAGAWTSSSNRMDERTADARVDAKINDFFGANTYRKAEMIGKNAKNDLHTKKGTYVAGGKVYTEADVDAAVAERVTGALVSDVKDEARLIVDTTGLSSNIRDAIVIEAGESAKAELRDIFNRGGYNGYSTFLNGSRTVGEKVRKTLFPR